MAASKSLPLLITPIVLGLLYTLVLAPTEPFFAHCYRSSSDHSNTVSELISEKWSFFLCLVMPFFSLPRTHPVGLALSAELIALFGTFLHLVARRGKWQSLLVGSLCQLLGVGVVAPVYMALVWSGQTKRTNARTTLHGAATSILVGFLLPTVWMLLSPGERSIALWQPVPVYIFAVHIITDLCPASLVPEMKWKRHVNKLIYAGFFLLHVYAIYLCVWQPAVSSDKLSSRDTELRVYATRFIAIDLVGVGVALLWAASHTVSDAVVSLLLGPGSIWKRLLA